MGASDETPECAEKDRGMRQNSLGIGGLAFVVAAVALAACQGNIGGGSGLSIPQAPGYQQPGGPAGQTTQSRERVLEGAVYLSSKLTSVPLPQLGGFGITIALGTPGPVVGETATTAAAPLAKNAAGARPRLLKTALVASPSPSAASTTAADGSASPGAAASGPSPISSASAMAEGSAVPAASGASASPAASAKPGHAASPSPSGSPSLPRIDTKLTVYPDDAPPPPTPMPTGEVQTFIKRGAVARGFVQMGTDVSLYGLGAVRFTLPSAELTSKRGFTIAIYASGKHNHNKLLNYDTDPTISGQIVYSSQTEPSIVLKKGSGYLLMIYGDEEPAAPSTVAPGYPSPGNNPFPQPSGYAQPGYTQIPGYPQGAPQTPYPGSPQTPYPGYPTTPYPGYPATPYPGYPTPYHT